MNLIIFNLNYIFFFFTLAVINQNVVILYFLYLIAINFDLNYTIHDFPSIRVEIN